MVEKAGVSARAGRPGAGDGRGWRAATPRSSTGSQAEFGSNAKAADGIARLRELVGASRTAGVPEERLRLDLSICPRPGLLHRHDLRDVPARQAGHRQRLLRRPLRQPRRPVHQAAAARRRRVAGPRPAAGGDGGAGAAAEGRDAGPGAGRAVRRRPARRLPAHGAHAAGARASASRSSPRRRRSGQQLQYAEQARLPGRPDRRAGRVRQGRVEACKDLADAARKRPCPRREAGLARRAAPLCRLNS